MKKQKFHVAAGIRSFLKDKKQDMLLEKLKLLSRYINKRGFMLVVHLQPTWMLYNLTEMKNNPGRWINTVFGVNDDVLIFAPPGGKYPFTKFIPEPVELRFKLLYGTLWEITGHFLSRRTLS